MDWLDPDLVPLFPCMLAVYSRRSRRSVGSPLYVKNVKQADIRTTNILLVVPLGLFVMMPRSEAHTGWKRVGYSDRRLIYAKRDEMAFDLFPFWLSIFCNTSRASMLAVLAVAPCESSSELCPLWQTWSPKHNFPVPSSPSFPPRSQVRPSSTVAPSSPNHTIV